MGDSAEKQKSKAALDLQIHPPKSDHLPGLSTQEVHLPTQRRRFGRFGCVGCFSHENRCVCGFGEVQRAEPMNNASPAEIGEAKRFQKKLLELWRTTAETRAPPKTCPFFNLRLVLANELQFASVLVSLKAFRFWSTDYWLCSRWGTRSL